MNRMTFLSYGFSFGVIAAPAMAQVPEITVPSWEEQLAIADQANFDNLLNFVKTSPNCAGQNILLRFKGLEYRVDRRAEPRRPGLPPPRLSVEDILGNVSADARSSLRISIKERYLPDGTVERDWQIDFGGQIAIDSGKAESDDKQHK